MFWSQDVRTAWLEGFQPDKIPLLATESEDQSMTKDLNDRFQNHNTNIWPGGEPTKVEYNYISSNISTFGEMQLYL